MKTTITIEISQPDVYDEVAKTTDYTGTKLMDADSGARERILATDCDLETLERFWEEAATAASESMKEMLLKEKRYDGGYKVTLEVGTQFNPALATSIEKALRIFFIVSITGQWFKFANKEEAADYFAQGAEQLAAIERMLSHRIRPKRPCGKGD